MTSRSESTSARRHPPLSPRSQRAVSAVAKEHRQQRTSIIAHNSLGSGQFPASLPPPRIIPGSPFHRRRRSTPHSFSSPLITSRKIMNDALTKARARDAQRVNDSMIYLEGAQIYTCGQCRTHLTSHDDIISKSFHGRHGRAYLFDQCVNVTIGPAEDRMLITGLHSVCDIFCKRCKHLIGWTYKKAYEGSQKYKEGKYIIEKINLHLETGDYYDIAPPAGERADRWRQRSMSWGSESAASIVFEYHPSSSTDEILASKSDSAIIRAEI